jgi:hypothetical protein
MGKGFRDEGGCQVCIEMSIMSFSGFSLLYTINLDMVCISVSITTSSFSLRIFFVILSYFILFYVFIYLFLCNYLLLDRSAVRAKFSLFLFGGLSVRSVFVISPLMLQNELIV